jgi:hypothetical protein
MDLVDGFPLKYWMKEHFVFKDQCVGVAHLQIALMVKLIYLTAHGVCK